MSAIFSGTTIKELAGRIISSIHKRLRNSIRKKDSLVEDVLKVLNHYKRTIVRMKVIQVTK